MLSPVGDVFTAIYQHALTNALAIFIGHDAEFKRIPSSLQNRNDRTVKSYDMFFLDFNISRGAVESLVDGADALGTFLDSVSSKYDTVVLIGHVYGGLAAKLYIINELMARRGDRLKVDLLIAWATPHYGSHVVNALSILGSVPYVGPALCRNAYSGLASFGPAIRRVRDHWNDVLICKTATASSTTTDRKLVQSITIPGKGRGTMGFSIDTPDLSLAGKRKEKVLDLIYFYLDRHANPSAILDEIARVCFSGSTMDLFIEGHVPTIADELNQLYGPGHSPEVSKHIIRSFLRDFPRRPLRGLSETRSALQKYAQLIRKEVQQI